MLLHCRRGLPIRPAPHAHEQINPAAAAALAILAAAAIAVPLTGAGIVVPAEAVVVFAWTAGDSQDGTGRAWLMSTAEHCGRQPRQGAKNLRPAIGRQAIEVTHARQAASVAVSAASRRVMATQIHWDRETVSVRPDAARCCR